MKYLLSRASRSVVEQLARESTLCAFDFDGTLAPIVDHPDLAAVRPQTLHLLKRLTGLYPCAVISGRSRTDLMKRISGSGAAYIIGSHGADTGLAPGPEHERLAGWKSTLLRELGGAPGVCVEDKGFSLTVHLLPAAPKALVRRLHGAVRLFPGARLFAGKNTINLVPDTAPDKGAALAGVRNYARCDWVLYAGDDDSDEPAFALPGNTISVRVGRKRGSRARYYLKNQFEIDGLLAALISIREEALSSPEGVRRS